MALGRNTIHKLGKRIRETYGDGTGLVDEKDLEMLQEYRLSYRDDIAAVFKILYDISKRVDKFSIVTYRVKRIKSIVEKLKRFPTAGLENFIDIAGCRCITAGNDSVYKIVKKLRNNTKLQIKQIKDYIQEPQPEGYQSVHLYVSLKDSDKNAIEIQIRSRKQHDWATLVEISDVIVEGARLKEYNEPKDLLNFHRILSIPENNLDDSQRKIYFDTIRKYNYIDLLHGVFMQNIALRYQWINTHSSALKNFYLIDSAVGKETIIKSYQTFQEAECAYFDRFKQDFNANLVLTQIPQVTFEQLSTAYSNYVLSTHNFIGDCLSRCTIEIRNAMQERNVDKYRNALDLYLNVIAHLIIRINQEIYAINNTSALKKNPKHREWTSDLQKQIRQLEARRDKLRDLYRETRMYDAFIITRLRFQSCGKELSEKYDQLVKQNLPAQIPPDNGNPRNNIEQDV